MAYPIILSRRMPYDIDGTEVAIKQSDPGAGLSTWLTPINKRDLNGETRDSVWRSGSGDRRTFWFFFPEKREITNLAFYIKELNLTLLTVEGSNDSTNGVDGTWNVSNFAWVHNTDFDSWRKEIAAVSFPGPIKALRLYFRNPSFGRIDLNAIHLYGYKAATETPDDILFCDASTGAEKTALMDWGDRPEGTTAIDSFKVKNGSATKIANDINLQLNHNDFLMSWSPDGPWTATLDIATLGVGALSNTIYVRNQLAPPLLILGPYAARVIASVGSWT